MPESRDLPYTKTGQLKEATDHHELTMQSSSADVEDKQGILDQFSWVQTDIRWHQRIPLCRVSSFSPV